MQTRTLEGTTVRLEYVEAAEEHFVSIYMDGSLWDWHSFSSYDAAQAFMADPFKEQRTLSERRHEAQLRSEAELIGYYAADYIRVSRGRQIGPNRR